MNFLSVSKVTIPDLKLSDTIRAEGRGLSRALKTERQGLLGSLKPEALFAIIKIRFTKPMSIIELISYLC